MKTPICIPERAGCLPHLMRTGWNRLPELTVWAKKAAGCRNRAASRRSQTDGPGRPLRFRQTIRKTVRQTYGTPVWTGWRPWKNGPPMSGPSCLPPAKRSWTGSRSTEPRPGRTPASERRSPPGAAAMSCRPSIYSTSLTGAGIRNPTGLCRRLPTGCRRACAASMSA